MVDKLPIIDIGILEIISKQASRLSGKNISIDSTLIIDYYRTK